MTEPSGLATTAFVAIVLAVAAFVVFAAFRAAASDVAGRGAQSPALALTGIFAVGLVVPAILARAGLLDRYAPMPAPVLLLVAAVTAGNVALALTSFGARVAAGVPLAALVGFQAFRLPVEWVLHRLYIEGVIPIEMTFAGRNFDIATGLLAIGLALYLGSGRGSRALVLGWNVLGLGLLANIVVIAVLSTPVPFRVFTGGPPNLLPGTFPFVWLPTFLVQAALFGHLVVFRALREKGRP